MSDDNLCDTCKHYPHGPWIGLEYSMKYDSRIVLKCNKYEFEKK